MKISFLMISLLVLLMLAESQDMHSFAKQHGVPGSFSGMRNLQNQNQQPNVNPVQTGNINNANNLQFGTDQPQILPQNTQVANQPETTTPTLQPNFNQVQTGNANNLQFGTDQPQILPQNTQAANQPETTTPALQPIDDQLQKLVPVNRQEPKILISDTNTSIIGKGFKVDLGVSYQRIQIKSLLKKYLFFNFNLAQTDQWQKVNLSIKRQGQSAQLRKCEFNGVDDSCYIPKQIILPNTVLFVEIKCQDDCTYNLNVQQSDLEHLIPGEQLLFMFGKETSQIYHVQLGKYDKLQEVRIHLSPRVTRRPFDNIKIYGKFGQLDPTPQDFDFKSVNLWEDGEGIFLSKKILKNNKNLSLLIIGQTQTTYKLICQVINSTTHSIQNGQSVYQYLDADSQKIYHLQASENLQDEYSLRFSTLSGGDLDIGYFSDVGLKTKISNDPFQYMKDSQYIFSSNDFKAFTNGIFIRVKTSKRDSTYTIKFIGRRSTDPVELNEHVYGFIPINKSKFAYFDFKRWAEETEIKTNLKFTVYMIEVIGKVVPSFLICQGEINLCTNEAYYKNHTTPIPSKPHDNVSQKQVYELEIQDKVLKKINVAEQQAIIIVRLESSNSNESLVALELLNNNKVLYLREGRPFEQKLVDKQMKIYKYINSDPNVKEIRVHLNQIAGHVILRGAIKNEENSQSIQIVAQSNTLRFTTNLTQPIFVSVTAESKAIFGISMQVIHKSDDSQNANIISISQDLTYTIKIQPNTYTIIEVVPIFYQFYFGYSSSQSVIACSLDQKTNQCINLTDPKSIPTLTTKGQITNGLLSDRKSRIKITNPFSDSVAEVTVIFHSRSFDHCESKKIGQVYSEVAKDSSCFSYLIQDETKVLDIYVSKRQYASLKYSVILCQNSIKNVESMKIISITPDTIAQMCKTSSQAKKLSIIWSVATKTIQAEDKSVKIDYLVQYRDDIIILPEGVSYNRALKGSQGYLAKFAYNLINKKATKIMLTQVRGRFQTYAKLVNETQKENQIISSINYHFTSSNTVDYSQEPIILISEKEIEEHRCIDCAILIAVYSLEQMGREVQFDIQVVQRFQTLNEDTAVLGYLEAGSYAFYNLVGRQQINSTILILLSDHNQQCANMYLALTQNAGPNNHIVKTIGANEMIFNHLAGERKYYLSVEAVKTCDYSLSFLTIDSSINNLKRGKQNMLKLTKGVVKYFSFQHYSDENFKIITLSKYGQIKLYLNQSFLSTDRKSFSVKELALQNFAYKSEISNSLSIDSNHPLFCKSCNYFLAVEALKNTQSTIYLAYPQTVINLMSERLLSDYLPKKSDYTLASYNKVGRTQIRIKVYKGTLNIVAIFKESKAIGKFNQKQQQQLFDFDFSSQLKKSPKPLSEANIGVSNSTVHVNKKIPVNLIISADTDNVIYSLQVKHFQDNSTVNNLAAYRKINAGQPNYIVISSTKVICVTGYFREINQELIITTNTENKRNLNSLIMQGKINNQKAEISTFFRQNIMAVNFNSSITKQFGNQFELCLKLAQPQSPKNQQSNQNTVQQVVNEEDAEEVKFDAIVFQSNTVNILPSDTQSVVQGQSTFVIHSEGQFLLDVFECNGQAKITYGNSMANVQKSKLKILDMVSMPDQRHAIKIAQKQTTFVKVNSAHSIVRWLPIDFDNQRGLGYMKYQSGDLKYSSKFKEISVQYQPLKELKATNGKIKEVEYYLYISNSSQSLEFASQCDSSADNVQMFYLGSYSLGKSTQSQYLIRTIEKEQLEKAYPGSENIYFNVVVRLGLIIPGKVDKDSKFSTSASDEHEHYRFIYHRQQIPKELYEQNQIESIPYHYLILLILSIGAVLVLFTYLFTRKIVPLVARLRNSNLVQQQPGHDQRDDHRDDLEVPASSDRNRRAPDTALETEDKM